MVARSACGGRLVVWWLFVAVLFNPSIALSAELRVLVYNTHGLPTLVAGDDPRGRFPEIGRHTERYALTFLQEDFAHHDRLREGVGEAALLERGNESRAPWCLFCSGSGLTTVSRLPPGWSMTISSHPYDACSGWLTSANDCLATKGFQLARIRTDRGAVFHVVNTHLDAGSGECDREARGEQLATIEALVQERVGAGSLIVVGDLNLDAHNEQDRELFDGFVRRMGLADSGARAAPGSDWEVLDYILYRSGPDAEISVLEAGEDRELVWEGRPLSDHPALFAVLDILPARVSGPSE